MSSQNDVDKEKRRLREIGMAQNRAIVDEEARSAAQYRQEMNEFNEHLTSIIIPELVDKSNIFNTNSSSLLNIVFPDIPQLNGVALVVPFLKDWKLWPHYKYDEIFSCIEKQYPHITSPKFQGKTYGVRIYVDGKDLRELGELQRTEIPNKATVELRYRPYAPSREEVWAAAGLPLVSAYDNLHNLEQAVSSLAPSASGAAAAPPPAPAVAAPAVAAPATIERVAMALWDTLPPPIRSNEDWNGKKQRAIEAAAALLDGGDMREHQGPRAPKPQSPPILPNGGNQYNYGGKKPKSKRGNKKSKSKKSKTKKSKSKSKRNKCRSYKRVN